MCKKFNVDQIKEILSSDSNLADLIESMPANLSTKNIAQFMGISRETARTLSNKPDFPRLQMEINRIIVPRPLFLDWYYRNIRYEQSEVEKNV